LASLVFIATIIFSATPKVAWAHAASAAASASVWHWRPEILSPLIFFGTLYARGWFRLRSLNLSAVSAGQHALYLLGLSAICIALISPIDSLATSLLSMHMVQHLLLLMIAPLCILLADPLPPLLWGLPSKLRRRAGFILAPGSMIRRVLWGLTLLPVSWALYVLNLWAWHHPALYQIALRNEWVHDLQHVLFFSTAVLFWWPIVNPAPRLHGEISYGYRIVYLVAATLQNTLLGMAISIPERVLYPFYATVPQLRELAPIDDQALGGGIMWVSGHMYLIPILVLIARLLKREQDTVNRSVAKEIFNRSQG
jgi:cytochrome c oxidase assembly factor CtaG